MLEYIKKRLNYLNIDSTIMDRYNETHRIYHDINHIIFMLEECKKLGWLDNDELFISIIFHDIVHHPLNKNNEELSVEFMRKTCHGVIDESVINKISVTIMDTVNHIPTQELSEMLIKLDLISFEKDPVTMLNNHKLVIKEYLQFYPLEDFKKGSLKLLKKFKESGYNVDDLIIYTENLEMKNGTV
jgi:predicted metal-dependent HD superfamily phosphohydrolase